VIVDVRDDKYFDGQVVPGAIHMPWSEFRYNDIGENLASVFRGLQAARDILGSHGIAPTDTVVLYDSVERDGGATASYVFWVLDVLGHKNKKILERGIDAWKEAGYEVADKPRQPEPISYQPPADSLRTRLLIDDDFIYRRLGDFYYQIVDVRSRGEYLGEKGSMALDGTPLNLGHIPTAVNINYQDAWTDPETKDIKPYSGLRELYKGLDPSKGVIVYCDSGRRSSFSYFILRLMGFENVYTYEASWQEWGNPGKFLPVETRENLLSGDFLPAPVKTTRTVQPAGTAPAPSKPGGDKPAGGYVSCGG
ncbi:MAG: sulfurtransferase, partial [Desulfobacteraceae bacterium]|nr:sulfurtransferase [Desulfobacteraceae bacterium]